MRILIPLGAAAAIGLLVSRPEWQHLSHSGKAAAVIAVAFVFAAVDVVAALARRRRSANRPRPRLPYAAPAKRR